MAKNGSLIAYDGENEIYEVEILDKECILIRRALRLDEQKRLFEYIQENDKTPSLGNKPKPMVPSPKTLILGEDQPSLFYEYGQKSVVNDMVMKATNILKEKKLHMINGFDISQRFSSLSMATIKYESPHGHFAPHIDHCNDSFVYLTSLGCTANFMVKGPTMDKQTHFKFHSGDLLIFNASTKAALLHSVVSIDKEGNEDAKILGEQFPSFWNHRYGVQCRMHFK